MGQFVASQGGCHEEQMESWNHVFTADETFIKDPSVLPLLASVTDQGASREDKQLYQGN